MTIDEILAERGKRYGDFMTHAEITQELKEVMRNNPGWEYLKSDMQEALDMVAHKIGRIINGDPEYLDSWVDIVGYVQLVVNRLRAEGAG